MAIFDNELVDNVRQDGSLKGPKPVLGSVPGTQIDFNVGPTGGGGGGAIYGPSSRKGLSLKELSDLGSATPAPRGYGQSFTAFRQSELNANQRYPLYQRGVDLENIYGLQQPWYQQLGYGVVKLAANTAGTFAQSLTNIPNTISAIKNREFSELSGDPEGYEGTIDNWMRNMDNVLPNYFTRYEREHPFLTAIPFTTGSANWWGGKFLPNLGFMVGSVAGAVVQDVAIGAVTEGIGEIPLVANQIGKASLWLNKLFTGTNAAERVTQIAIGLGKTEQQILNMKKLAELSAAAKMNSGFRYGMALYGASMTESGVESRNSYRGVKDQLTKDYIAQYGEEPGFEDAQKIEDYATNAMNTNFGINMALLVASNTLQFGNLFRSMTSAKGAVQELEGLGRVGLKEGSLDVFEKKTAQSFLGKVWDSVKPTASNIFREGVFEEGGQFAAERGTYDYYTRKYKSDKYKDDWDNVDELIKSTTFGMNEQFGSQEGIENMLIGAITGLLVGKAQNIYEKRKGIDDDSKLAKSINILNRFGVTSTLQNNYDNTVTQLGIAKDMQDAARANDVFRYKNLKEDAFFTYVQSRLPSKMHDVTIMQLEMLKDLPKEEFQQMFQLDFNETNKATVSQYVDALIEKANDIKKTTDAINNVFVNPFQNNPDASDLEGLIESDNYNTFEKYKTDLSYYATTAPNVNSRLNSIQQSVNTIVPGVTNDLLAQLTSNDGLKGLSEFYEQRAKELNESITEFTTPLDKKNLRDQIKALRTRSERISASLKSNKIDSKLFENLLNFEINGRDVKLENVVPIEQVDQLLEYGTDINRLNERKNIASKAYDALSTKEGFQKYFEQESEITADKDKDVEEKEKGKETIVPAKPLEFVNKAGATEIPQIDREYQLDIKPTAKVNKIADDRYEVVAPSGESTFYPTKEDADQAVDDINSELEDLQKVKVLDINEDGTIKIEDVAGNIQNIDPKLLTGYEKIESAEEKLMKDKDLLDRQQAEIENNSATSETPPPPTPEELEAIRAQQGKLKSASKLFISGTTPAERPDEPIHIRNSREFLNNAKNFKNRGNLAAILVTPNQEAALGLSGLTELSYGQEDASDATNIETGLVAQVFVEQDGGKTYFVDKNGERIGEIGKPVDVQQVIFQNMPTPSLYDRSGKLRARADQMAEAEAASKAWATKRAELFNSPAFPVKAYRFAISRGVSVTNIVDGKYERNQVGGILIPENRIATQEGLLQVAVDGFVVHNGENITFPKGLTVLQYGDTLEIVNNNKLGQNKAEAVYMAIKTMMDKFEQTKKLDINLTTYLQNVLYWRKSPKTSGNQIYIDTAAGQVFLGGKKYSTVDLDTKKTEIINQLKETWHAINNTTLKKNFYDNFYEYKVENGKLVEQEWPNYQSYLLSSKGRSADQTPLVTKVAKPDAIPYSFKQKYATLIDFELPVIQTPKPAPAAEKAAVEGKPVIGDFIMDGATKNTYTAFNSGPVDFTGTVDADGNVNVDIIVNDTITNVAKNSALVNDTIVPDLKKAELFDASADDIELVSTYVANILALKLKNFQQATPVTAATFTPTTPYGTPTGEEVTTAVTEAPVSDIEKSIRIGNLEITQKVNSKGNIEREIKNVDSGKSLLNVITPEGKSMFFSLPNLNEAVDSQSQAVKDVIGDVDIAKELAALEEAKPAVQPVVTPTPSVEERPIEYGEVFSTGTTLGLDNLFGNVPMGFPDFERKPGGKHFEQFIIKNKKIFTIVDPSISDAAGRGGYITTSIMVDKNSPTTLDDVKADLETIHARTMSGVGSDRKINKAKVAAALTGVRWASRPSAVEKKYNPENTGLPDDEYMRVGVREAGIETLTDAQIELFKAWASEKVPTIPYEVLDNLVNTYDNEKAWGVFEKGVAKFYKGAPGTTPYHEVFEGIWKGFLTPEQRQLILDEFRSKSGQFTDRASGKKINYADATDQQAKERMADDFGAFRVGKLPARTLGERILKFFRNIIEFFKSFVQKPSMKEELFRAIEAGKFKDMVFPGSVETAAPEYMRIPGLTETQAYEFVQDMTARARQFIIGDSKNALYDLKEITGAEIFNRIKEAYIKENKYQTLGDERYNKLVIRTKEKLRTLGINFNDEDTVDINDENVTNRDYAPEPFSTDWKKTSPFPIKFISATLLEVEPTNQQNASSLSLPKRVISSIKGYKLVSFGKVFNTLLDKISNTSVVKNVEEKLLNLAKHDATYVRFFQSVGGNLSTGTFDFDNFKNEDWRLFINFFQTFTKQKPDAVIQYIDGTSVYTAPANQFTASKLIEQEWFENIKALADDPKSIIKRNKKEKTFDVDVNKLPISVPKEPQPMVNFLTDLGIGFPLSAYVSLDDLQKDKFSKAVGGIYTYIKQSPSVGTLTGKTLKINAQISKLANLYIEVTNPSQDTTYFGVEGQRIQSYADNNVPSVMENEFNSVSTIEELKQLRPELNDVFSKNSITLKDGNNFYNAEGKRYKLLKIGYIQGTNDLNTDDGTTTGKLTLGKRFTQEINENLSGNYYILVPADSSTEWQINLGNHMTFADVVGGRAWTKINKIFRGYITDEIALALDADNRKQIKNIGDKAKQLRFMRDILSDKDVKNIEGLITEGKTQEQIEKYVDDNIESINSAIADFINTTVTETRQALINNGEINQIKEDQFSYNLLQDEFASTNDINKFKMTSDDINNLLTFANANYVINNIELHKLIFGDPYEFKIKNGKLDETKRIKSFLSPRRTTFDSGAYNAFLNKEYNMAGDIELAPEDPGYHLHKSFINTVTLADIELSSDLYPNINEADAASWIMDNTYREVKLKNGQWTTEAEAWHQWQMAYTRNKLAAKGVYTYTSERLQKADNELISKPEPVFVTDVLKPIVSGVKAGENKIDNVLDKFSQMSLYYKDVEGRALETLYIKMWKENIGYAVFESGRKVGATELQKLYNSEGAINEKVFSKESIVKVPWKAYGIQVETAFENPKDQTRGSQLTKLSSLDLFSDGEGSPEAKKAYERNLKVLDMLHESAYNNLLKRLGLEDLGDGFRLVDPAAIQETLEYELLRREMSENAKDTIKRDENGQFIIPFEASPAYKQIKDILFSMVNKALVSPKMNGGPKVQVPVTGWETQNRKPDEPNPELKFYTKGDPYVEVLLPHWFRGKFSKKKFPNDEAILKYLNSTEEGKSILRGVGFRIPTQAMSSIETFRVKGFLPQSMGDTIVVPSEVTAKAGSDFDIDKMNTYLKSIYVDKNGDIRLVKYQGSEEATKEFFAKVFDETLEKQKVKKAELLEATQILSLGLDDPNNLVERYSNLLDVLLEDVKDSSEFENKIMQELGRLGDVDFQQKLKDKFVEDMYNRSLQNEYYESLEQMITLPENFDRLVAPVDDAGLSELATELDKLRGEDETAIKGRLLNRGYMTTLRNSFVTAKAWVGRAAVNITGQSLTQKSKVYIDPAKFAMVSDFDRKILGDGVVNLPHNTVEVDGKQYVSISGKYVAEKTYDKDGKEIKKYISDRLSGYATSFVDVAKDPYIMKIIGSDSIVSTFLFLERIGAGENTIWFLNQPIIREYLSYLDSIGKKGLFGKKDGEYIRSMFPTSIKNPTFDPATLKDNIKKYYSKEFNNEDNATQQAIFTEFLKYAKMAQYNFKLTQATNYDTTKFRNSDEFNRKQTRTTQARDTNIFSSVDKILDSSFIGKQAELIDDAMSSLGEVIKTERDDYTIITDDVLKPFMEREFMSGDEFNRIAGKIKASFLDYIIQTQSTLNTEIEALVVGSNSVADQLAKAKKNRPEMKILNELQVTSSDRIGGAKSVRLRANIKDAYDEDMYTDMMRELKLVEPELYNGLLKIAVLQGVYQSSISIKNIMPIEDYAPLIKTTIDTLSSTEDVKNFTKGAFYKNNWKDNTIVPTVNPKFFLASEDPVFIDDNTGVEIYKYDSPTFPSVDLLGIDTLSRKVLLLSEVYNSSAVQNDFVKIPRVVTDAKTGERIDIETGLSVTNADFARRKAVGDMSLKDFYGYQKVKYANGQPVITLKGEHVYKLVNLYGDGQLVSEYYLDNRPSVINNGTVKIDNEVSDIDLIKFFGNQEVVEETVVPSQPVETTTEKINIYAGTGENADLSNFAVRPFNIGNQTFNTVEGAFQAAKLAFTNDYLITGKLRKGDQEIINELRVTTGAEAKKIGRKIEGLNRYEWDRVSSNRMKSFLRLSFEQNPAALERLLATGNATLTHKYKGVEQDGGRFSKLLMEVREEFRGKRIINFEQSFSAERQEEILNNFATKHNMTKEAARKYIDDAIASKGQEVIDKLNECY